MTARILVKTAEAIKRFFYVFLDISGILLGVFLIGLGWWMFSGRALPAFMKGLVLFLGIAAFIIHTGHYFSLRITRWIFGKDDYFLTRSK